MFIHLGGDMVLKAERIVAILDHQSESHSADNQTFMKKNGEEKRIERVTEDPAKSIVITREEVYLSPISSHTLKRRAENPSLEPYEEEITRENQNG
ncbi:extracellular matrix regulator RemB [Alkalicoccus chagannorensis]|uniref:extracellular matrix regulator RemB n=1 Tax=Alkalicoccus chagannorensis TaxID=427072 RepID=UPI00041164BB|nr:extracellular matrix/biofilm biosynthesis regulator RemA family protein [Alkalicoccus chagannorensis]